MALPLFPDLSSRTCWTKLSAHHFLRENPTPGFLPLMVQLIYYRDPQVGLPFGQILGQNGPAQGFNVKPMRLAQAIKWYYQPYIHLNPQSFSRGSPQMPWVLLRRTEFCVCGEASQVRSPRILLASWMSLGKMVTHLAWMAQRLVSLNNPMRYALAASWSASSTEDWNHISCATSIVISQTNLWNGSFLMRNPVNFLIVLDFL